MGIRQFSIFQCLSGRSHACLSKEALANGVDSCDSRFFFHRIQTAIYRAIGISSKRRRRSVNRDRFSSFVECVESRFCLSAESVVDTTAPPITTQVGADGSLYIRLGNPQAASPLRGIGGVALEGGGTDVDQAFQWMIGRMGGKGDFLVIRAGNDSLYNPYIYDMGGTNSVATLAIPNRAAAMDPKVQQIILNANAVFIAGGSQNNYVDWWQGTGVQSAIATDIARGVPIGGTSAGTDVLGQFIYSAEFGGIRSPQAMTDPSTRT